VRILVGGGGQVAELIARRLIREGNELVLVDQDAERCRLLEERLDARVVQGSIAGISTLQKAGLADAEMLLAITTSDEANILACMIAQVESNVRVKVVRLRTHEVAHWKRVAEGSGLKIDLIIHPETDLSERIMRVVGVPGVSDIVDFFDGNAKLFGMNVDADSWAAGNREKALRCLDELLSWQSGAPVMAALQTVLSRWLEVKSQAEAITRSLPVVSGSGCRQPPAKDLARRVAEATGMRPFLVELDLARTGRLETDWLLGKRIELTELESQVKSGLISDGQALTLFLTS